MDHLLPIDRDRLKSLISGKKLTTAEQISTFNILRTRFSDLLTSLPNITRENLQNNTFLINYFAKKSNRDAFKKALRTTRYEFLSPTEQADLAATLEEPAAAEGVSTEGTAATSGGQEVQQPAVAGGGSAGGGMPGMPSMSAPAMHPIFRVQPPTPPLGGMEGGTGIGAAATAKGNRIEAERATTTAPVRPAAISAGGGPTRFNFSNFKSHLSNFGGKIRNLASPAGPFLKVNSGRIGNGLKNIFGNAANFGGRAGLGAINHGGNALSNLSNNRLRLSKNLGNAKSNIVKGGKKRVVLLFAGIFFMIFFMGMLSGTGGTTPTGEAAPISTSPTTGSGGDISSCKFNYQGNKYEIPSSTLRGLITEVAGKTGVPASVLAGVAMHEGPAFTPKALDSHDAFQNKGFSGIDCLPHFPTSDTGALGLMQVQTPENLKPQNAKNYNPAAVSLDGIKRGLAFLGRDISSLATQDFCDIRTNIYLGAGVLISKNGGIPPTTADQVKNAVCGYYGSPCTYNGFNYGDEVKSDFENCQSQSPVTPPITTEGHACATGATYVPFPGYQSIKPGEYSYVCGHCTPIFNAIDAGVNPTGGTPVLAVTDGKTEDISNPIGGTALWLTGNDGRNYYYAHLQRGGLVVGGVKAGQVIGSIASASDTSAKNNGVAHVHFSAGTPGNRQDFKDPANIPAGPLLDSWCNNNVCNGKPNVAYACRQ